MFIGGKKSRQQHRLDLINRRLLDIFKVVQQIEQTPMDHVGPAYDVVQKIEMLSYTVFEDPEMDAKQVKDQLFNNAAECVFQLVTLTLLSVNAKRPPTLNKIQDVIVNDYPVAHLNSRFQFQNPELTYQRLHLMAILQTLLDPITVKDAVYQFVVDRIQAFVLK